MKFLLIAVFVCLVANAHGARFLFDADHAESAGNADWVIDADLHNLTWNSSGGFTTNMGGSESNAQRIPTPAANGITSNTVETYWAGAISAWAVDLVKRGHSVETLPAGTTLTYNTANVQDLTNYNAVIIDEPGILFATSEKQALLNFVASGGGLFIISDHVGAIRTSGSGGIDAVTVLNDFLTNNGLTNNPFGITFRTTGTGSNSSGNNTFNRSIVGNPILNGPVGVATNMAYFNGNEFQIDNTKNPTTTSHMWFGAASDSNNFCGLASLQYGNGRVVVCGDSSCIDDGTGDPNDSSLFDGYTTDAGGVQHIWILNSSEWLAAASAVQPASVGVTNVTPSCGPTTGKTSVTISGSNFVSGATVTIGGVGASNVVVVGSNTITALSPTNTVGTKTVQVTNIGGKFGALTNGFSYVTALSFAGLASATPATEAATLSWSAGTGAVSYNVFQATTSGAENYGSPALTTNAVSVLFAPLYPGSNSPITYFFVVRAVDGCGNPDTNTVEISVQPLLDPAKDQDGDGIPNGFEQAYGLNPFNAADANADPDGDGMSNLQEYLAGTDPTNGASAFRITAVAQETSGVRVAWMTGLNKTNALQSTTGLPDGSYSNNFIDLYIVTNTISVTTNYLDQSTTNLPASYYRVRLVP